MTTQDDSSALQRAVKGEDEAEVRKLLNQGLDGAPANHADDQGHTVLVWAAAHGNVSFVEALLKALPEVEDWEEHSDLQDALDAAAEGGHVDIVQLLIAAGADPSEEPASSDQYGEGLRCPVCFKWIYPGAELTCAHWIGSLDEYYQSDEVTAALVELLEELDGNVALAEATAEFKALYEGVLQHGATYWTELDGVVGVGWDTDGMLGSSGGHFFHADPTFPAKIAEQATAGLAWLQARFSGRAQDAESYD